MQGYRSLAAGLGVVLAVCSYVMVGSGQQPVAIPPNTPRIPMAPNAPTGNSVTPALEGWFKNADGTSTILVGYNNRNSGQTIDIPVGPNNKIEPAAAIPGVKGMDYGQPTHFEPGRGWGVFSITVPANWGTKRLTYTIIANGQTQAITLWTNVPYGVAPYFRSDNGNTPPVLKLDESGPEFTGPPKGIAKTMTAAVGQPLTLTAWATDIGNTIEQSPPLPPQAGVAPPGGAAAPAGGAPADAGRGGRGGGRGGRGGDTPPAAGAAQDPAGRGADAGRGGRGGGGGGGRGNASNAPINLRWALHSGAGDVKFADITPAITADTETGKLFKKAGPFSGKATTTATFAKAGDYIVRLQANDASGNGGGGDQCCWTNVHIKVSVK